MFDRNSDLGLKMTYKVSEVADKLRENRDTHMKEYEETYAAYRKKLIFDIESALHRAAKGEDVERYHDADKPTCHKGDYDQAIMMLENTIQNEIDLDSTLFRNLMMDEWDWSSGFTATRTGYFPTGSPVRS